MLYSRVARTILVLVASALTQTCNAEHPHDHDKEECSCAQHEADHPFAIDCANDAAIRAATVTLESTCQEATGEYEWGGAFATPANAYTWVSQARDGDVIVHLHCPPASSLQPSALRLSSEPMRRGAALLRASNVLVYSAHSLYLSVPPIAGGGWQLR